MSIKSTKLTAAEIADRQKPATVEVHLKVRSHYKKLVASKILAGLPDSLARDTARRQIEHDHGIDVARAALAANELDRDEVLATAGVNSNAAQSVDRPAGTAPVEVKLDENKSATDDI